MVITVLAATNLESAELIGASGCRFESKNMGFNTYHVNMAGVEVFLIESGPGLANASAAAALAIEKFNPAHMINVGVCGVYSKDPGLLNSVVTAKNAVFSDAGVETGTFCQDMQDIGLPFYSGADGTNIYNHIPLCDDPVPDAVLRGCFLSRSSAAGDFEQAEKIKKRFEFKNMIMCEDMETAAVALVAFRADIPCIAVRGISNLCGDRNYQNWKLKEAAESAQKVLLKTISRMNG